MTGRGKRRLAGCLVAPVLLVALMRHGTRETPMGSVGWLERGLARVAASVQNRAIRSSGIDFLWGPICRFAVPVDGGFLAGIGFSVVYLRPGPDGWLEPAAQKLIGTSLHAALAAEGQVFMAAGLNGLMTLDPSDPTDVRVVAPGAAEGYALWVARSDRHLVVAYKEGGGLAVFRMEPPGPARLVRQMLRGESFSQVAVHGAYAIAVGHEKLVVLDLTDPDHPEVRSSVGIPYGLEPKPTDPMPRRVGLHWPYAFVANGARGIVTVNLEDLDHPFIESEWEDVAFCDWLVAAGDAVYQASEGSAVELMDVHEPLGPRSLGALQLPDRGEALDPPGDVPPERLTPFALGARGLFLLDVARPLDPRVVHAYVPPPYAHRVRVIDDQAYVAAASGGVEVYGLADPAHPALIGVLDTYGFARDLKVVDGRLWVADVLGWLLLTRPVEGEVPALVLDTDRGGHAWAVDVDPERDRIYLANSQQGLAVLERRSDDLADGFQATGEAYAGSYSIEVAGRGDHAYVGTVGNGVAVFEIEGGKPRLTQALRWRSFGPMPLTAFGTAVELVGERLYVGDNGGRLVGYDLADPSAPAHLWTEKLGGAIYDIEPAPEGLWVSAGDAGVFLVDASGVKPRVVGHVDVDGRAMSTARYGARVLVAAGERGLESLPVPPAAAVR